MNSERELLFEERPSLNIKGQISTISKIGKYMITTSIPLGYIASADYIAQCFDSDYRIPRLVAAEFDAIADDYGVSATLNVHTSSVDIDIEDLPKLPDADGCESIFDRWLEEALQTIQERWMEGEV